MPPEIVKFFASLIEKETGIVFHDSNFFQLKTRLEDIVKLEKLSGVEELMRKFTVGKPGPLLLQRLLDHSTNNETLFFRDPSFFPALSEFVKSVVGPGAPSQLRFWSAASSTGQEAVSLALTLEELSCKFPLPPYSILGTDISERALTKARSGVYSDFEVSRGLPEALRSKYFKKTEEGWRVSDRILNRIQYQSNNLLRPSIGPNSFHVILCRNVLIYQNVERKARIVNSLLDYLAPRGAIFLGVGETLVGVTETVKGRMIGNVIVYEKNQPEKKAA